MKGLEKRLKDESLTDWDMTHWEDMYLSEKCWPVKPIDTMSINTMSIADTLWLLQLKQKKYSGDFDNFYLS